MTAIETDTYILTYTYKGISRDGYEIVEDTSDSVAYKTVLWRFLKKAENLSLRNRTIYSDLNTSKEYMALIKEFQKA